jgi:glycerol-1-phosphate dehydrogenase [NAD(P)+]
MEGYGRDWDPPLSHGFKVGLGTVAMCALYEKVLDLDLCDLDIEARLKTWPTPDQDEARVRALQPHPVICEASVIQSSQKHLSASQARSRLELIRNRWKQIRTRIAEQVLPAQVVERSLREVGAVHHPSQIHVSMDELRIKYYQAQTIRTRYTVMDLLHEVGLFSTVVDSLFSPGGYWFHSRAVLGH